MSSTNTMVYGVINGGNKPICHHHIQTRRLMSRPCSLTIFKTNHLLPDLSLNFDSTRRRNLRACVGNLCPGEEEERESSLYDLLGVSEGGTLSDIKQAYKQLARKYHPDVSPPDRVEEYTKLFIQIREAYETLSDPNGRALYDRDMAARLHFAASAAHKFRHRKGLDHNKDEWSKRWEIQLRELQRRRENGDSGVNLSWGARMRRSNQINHQ